MNPRELALKAVKAINHFKQIKEDKEKDLQHKKETSKKILNHLKEVLSDFVITHEHDGGDERSYASVQLDSEQYLCVSVYDPLGNLENLEYHISQNYFFSIRRQTPYVKDVDKLKQILEILGCKKV